MVKDEIELLADTMNKAEGTLGGMEGITKFEEIVFSRQSRIDDIVKETSRTGEVPENLVPEIRAKVESKSPNDAKVSGKFADIRKGLNQVLSAGKKPTHVVIEDDKFEIFGRNNDDNEPDR